MSTESPLTEFQSQVIHTWSWGGFAFNWIYLANMRAWKDAIIMFLLSWIPLVNLAAMLYYSSASKKIAWNQRKWRDFDDFLGCQRRWDLWAKILLPIGILIGIVSAMNH